MRRAFAGVLATFLLGVSLLGANDDPALEAVRADARAVAEKQIAISKLQAMQTGAAGSPTTPEQERIGSYIAKDGQFIQTRAARWTRTSYGVTFASAISTNMRDPKLLNEDPFKASDKEETEPGAGFDLYRWFTIGCLVALVCGAGFVALRGAMLVNRR